MKNKKDTTKSISNADEDISLIQFGKNLKQLRIAKKITQEKLALENDFNTTYISLLERGKRNPSLKTIKKLATHLEVKISILLDGV